MVYGVSALSSWRLETLIAKGLIRNHIITPDGNQESKVSMLSRLLAHLDTQLLDHNG